MQLFQLVRQAVDKSPSEVLACVNILFADSDEEMLRQYRLCVERVGGWTGTYLKHSSDLLDALNGANLRIDAVVTDVHFASEQDQFTITGLTVARELLKQSPETVVLFVTEYSNSIVREEARRIGAELLEKPITADEVLAHLASALYNQRVLGNSPETTSDACVLVKPSDRINNTLSGLRREYDARRK